MKHGTTKYNNLMTKEKFISPTEALGGTGWGEAN